MTAAGRGDAIRLVGVQAFCRVGHTPEERATGHHIEVDVELSLDLREAGRRDAMEATVDYAAVHRAVLDAVGGGEFALLEAVAEAVAAAARKAAGDRVDAVVARVRKQRPPVPEGLARYAEVEVRR